MVPTVDDVVDIAHRMLWLTVQLSLPTLITALVVGVGISLVQTVTGVQEMTITFVPKLIAVVAVLALSMTWSIQLMLEYIAGEGGLFAMFSSQYGP